MSDKSIVVKSEPSVALMLQAVIDKGVTSDNVKSLEALVGLYERMQDRDAVKQFNEAFLELQKEIPKIQATVPVKNRDGTVRFKYAPLPDIEEQLRPIALARGFTWSYSEGASTDTQIEKVCTIYHTAGHSRRHPYRVTKSAPPGATATQGDGSTHSYAKRGCLCDAFSIITHDEEDAKNVGASITESQAQDLETRAKLCGADIEALLKYAGAADFPSIPEDRYDEINRVLKKKAGATKRNDKGEIEW